ncbi:MAG TPA: hypothetical protein VJW93_01715, partial [Candidatus Acidoferrales bacterium]|nr:hypothetical protein [Candidatus Acidoferrales bacterium]
MKRRNQHIPLSDKLLRDLASLTDDARRKTYFARHRQLFRQSAVRQINEIARTKLRVDTRGALALAECAIVIARKIRDEESLGRSLRNKANALQIIGDNQTAL